MDESSEITGSFHFANKASLQAHFILVETDGINEELIKLSLEPRDIDLLVSNCISLEAAKDWAVQWMEQAISKHPYPKAKVLKTENLKLNSPAPVTTASILYLKNGIPRPQNILYAIDLTQKIASAEDAPNTAKEIEPYIYSKNLRDIITDETKCFTSLSGGQTRALKAVIRLCTLAILETREHKLDMRTKVLLEGALCQIPGHDQFISQLLGKLSESKKGQSIPSFSRTL